MDGRERGRERTKVDEEVDVGGRKEGWAPRRQYSVGREGSVQVEGEWLCCIWKEQCFPARQSHVHVRVAIAPVCGHLLFPPLFQLPTQTRQTILAGSMPELSREARRQFGSFLCSKQVRASFEGEVTAETWPVDEEMSPDFPVLPVCSFL